MKHQSIPVDEVLGMSVEKAANLYMDRSGRKFTSAEVYAIAVIRKAAGYQYLTAGCKNVDQYGQCKCQSRST